MSVSVFVVDCCGENDEEWVGPVLELLYRSVSVSVVVAVSVVGYSDTLCTRVCVFGVSEPVSVRSVLCDAESVIVISSPLAVSVLLMLGRDELCSVELEDDVEREKVSDTDVLG